MEVFRSLSQISNFFTDRQHFEWMLDSAISIQKAVQPEDPPCLESALTICMLKSAAFAPVTVCPVRLMSWIRGRGVGIHANGIFLTSLDVECGHLGIG